MVKKKSLSKSVIKNSTYNATATVISRLGGLLFTVILARILAPELFGTYSLVLSILLFATAFTDLGTGKTLIRYVSESLGHKNKAKATSYLKFIFKFKFFLSVAVILLIFIFGKFISNVVFDKPQIYYPLLFGTLFVFSKTLFDFFKSLFTAIKDLKKVTSMQIIYQTSRILLVLLVVYIVSEKGLVQGVFVALAISILITSLIAFIMSDKKLLFGKSKSTKIQKSRVLNYLFFISFTVVTLNLFGSVDTLILGKFVDSEFLGYYRAAFSLAVAAGGLFGFGAVLLPVFTQIHGNRLERGFKKAFKFITILAIPSAIGVSIISKHFINAIYGKAYLTSAIPLYVLSLSIIIMPLVALYSSLAEAKEKPKILSKYILISLIINIILNIILIKWFLKFGQEYAILGAGIATILSRGIYLGGISKKTKEFTKIRGEGSLLIRPLVASVFMGAFLILFNKFVDINLYWGVLEIILGAAIYFGILFWIKGFSKKEVNIILSVFRKKFRVKE